MAQHSFVLIRACLGAEGGLSVTFRKAIPGAIGLDVSVNRLLSPPVSHFLGRNLEHSVAREDFAPLQKERADETNWPRSPFVYW